MRTINIKAGMSSTPEGFLGDFSEERQPCWYADVEVAEKRKDYKWKVGCKHEGNTNEYSFKAEKIGNVDDDTLWNRITGADFAIELLDLFKSGGTEAVKKWVKNGCPT